MRRKNILTRKWATKMQKKKKPTKNATIMKTERKNYASVATANERVSEKKQQTATNKSYTKLTKKKIIYRVHRKKQSQNLSLMVCRRLTKC